jgi:hypothetical protein
MMMFEQVWVTNDPLSGSVQLIDPLKVSDSGCVAVRLGVVYDPGAEKLVLSSAGENRLSVSESVSVEVAVPVPPTLIVALNGTSTNPGSGVIDIAQVNDGTATTVSEVLQ